MKRGATIADLASEFLARMSGSAGAGSSLVVVPTLRVSQCATGPSRERKVCPKRSRMEGLEPAHLLLLYDDYLVAQHP